jgi:2-dehydro-3-deoxygluconokinase
MSKLPPNQLGDGAITHLKSHGVDTTYVVRGSTTIGIYFLETGFGGRPSKVIYNRKHSAITRIQEDEFDWDEIFKDATWFHLSGITLALGERVRKVAFRAVKEAKKHNVPVSFDFNYRSKLWTVEEAKPVYKKIMEYVNIVFASFYDANTILEIPLDPEFEGKTLSEKRRNVFPKMIKKYNLHYIFGTDRVVYTATDNSLAGYYFWLKDNELSWELTEPIRFNIFDRIGGGDAFASGVIHGLLLNYHDPAYAVRYGLNTSVLKHTIYGDASTMSCEDIETFMAANGTAEVVR